MTERQTMASDPRKTSEDTTPETGQAAETAPQPEAETDDRPSAEELVPGLAEAIAEEESSDAAARIAALEAERDELMDKLLRALAETENVRRRADRDRKDAETYGGTRLARDLLSVHDNLERALANADETLREQHAGFLEGVELTRRELLNAFAKHRIEKVEPETGERFDPHRHQAMFEAPAPGLEPGTVMQMMQAGFTIADRLLRPALVGVAKAAPEAPPASADTQAPDGEAGDGEASGEETPPADRAAE